MPSVMDARDLVEYVATDDSAIETSERPQPHRVRLGFWRTLAQKVTRCFTPRPRQQYTSSCHAHRPFETPAEQLARQFPTLYLRASCGV
jgi:hypothetical protein